MAQEYNYNYKELEKIISSEIEAAGYKGAKQGLTNAISKLMKEDNIFDVSKIDINTEQLTKTVKDAIEKALNNRNIIPNFQPVRSVDLTKLVGLDDKSLKDYIKKMYSSVDELLESGDAGKASKNIQKYIAAVTVAQERGIKVATKYLDTEQQLLNEPLLDKNGNVKGLTKEAVKRNDMIENIKNQFKELKSELNLSNYLSDLFNEIKFVGDGFSSASKEIDKFYERIEKIPHTYKENKKFFDNLEDQLSNGTMSYSKASKEIDKLFQSRTVTLRRGVGDSNNPGVIPSFGSYNNGGFTFATDSLEAAIMYAEDGISDIEKSMSVVYEAEAKLDKLFVVDAKGSPFETIKYFGDGLSEESKQITDAYNNISIIKDNLLEYYKKDKEALKLIEKITSEDRLTSGSTYDGTVNKKYEEVLGDAIFINPSSNWLKNFDKFKDYISKTKSSTEEINKMLSELQKSVQTFYKISQDTSNMYGIHASDAYGRLASVNGFLNTAIENVYDGPDHTITDYILSPETVKKINAQVIGRYNPETGQLDKISPQKEKSDAKKSGEKIGEAIAEGVKSQEDNIKGVIDSVTKVDESILDDAKKSGEKIGEAIAEGVKSQDKIEPVVETIQESYIGNDDESFFDMSYSDFSKALADLKNFKVSASETANEEKPPETQIIDSIKNASEEQKIFNDQVSKTEEVQSEIPKVIEQEIQQARTLRNIYDDIIKLLEEQRSLHGISMEFYADKYSEFSTKGTKKYLGSEEAVVAKMSEHAKELKELMKDSGVSSKDLESKWATQIALIQRYNDIAKYKKDRPMSNDMAAQITGIKPELFQQNKNALLSWVSKLGKLQKEYDNLNKDLSPIAKAEENVLYGLITIQKQLTQGTPVKDKAYEMLSKVFGELKQIYPEADITQYTNLADVINLITGATKQQTKEIKSNTKAKEENKKVDIPVITTDEGIKTTKEEFVNLMKKASQKKSQEKDLTTNVTLTPRISESFKTEAENLINKLELSADINLKPKISEKFKADVSQNLNNIPLFDDLNASAAINSENESLRKMSDTLATIIGQIQEKTNAFLAESEVVKSSVPKENDLLEKISDKLILIKDFLDKISNINLENEINDDVVSDANNKNAKLKEESNIVDPVISEVIDSLARFNSSLSDIASNLYKVGEVFEDDSIQKKLMRDRKTSRSKENTKNNKAWEDRAKATVLREEQAAAAKAKAEGEAQAKQIAEQVKAQAAEQKSQEKFDKYLENFKTKYRKKEQAQEEKEINDLLSERKKLLKDIFSLTDKVSNLEESGLNAEQTKVILNEKKQEYTKVTLKYKSKTGSESADIVSILNDRQTSNAFSSKKQQDTATSELEKRYANLVKSFESISKKNYLKTYVNEANEALEKLRQDGFDKTSESITKYEENLNNLYKKLNTNDSKSGSLKKVSVMLQGVNKTLQDNSAMDPGLAERFTKLRNELEGYVNAGEVGAKKVAELAVAQSMLNSELERSGKKGRGGFATIAEHLKSINAQFIAQYFSIQDWIRYFRQALTVITEFDTALTEMRKVSNETVASLQRYQKTTFDISTSLGTTALALQQSTADWMRLGESLTEASKSAQAATMLMNVSEFESIDEATTSLVSMSQAYKDLSKMDIIDSVNKVGNEFSISTSGLAEALQSSAAVLSTQGNNFAEAIALVTAGKKLPEYIVIYI